MCGINGIFDPEGTIADPRSQIAAMNGTFVYRGPDGEGSLVDCPVSLGMRRLAIIDLTGGHQPLFNEDRSVALVCNGEIYNHVELRARLEQQGHRFATSSDCETLVHLYEEHELEFLNHLRGMFAIILWDKRRGRLLAARDRLGLKPLYIVRRGRLLALSSELKALTSTGLASTSIQPQKFFDSLRFSYPIDSRQTLAQDVQRVPPGHFIIADEGGISERRFWDDDATCGLPATTADDVEGAIDESIRLHLRSDVPIAILLSGGLDSALIASYARHHTTSLMGISAGYHGQHDCDERADARLSAKQIGLELLEVELEESRFVESVPEIARHCDEPALDIASIAQWALYDQCRRLGYKVVLSGIGGDELFFGYPAWNEIGARLADGQSSLDDRTYLRRLRSQLGGWRQSMLQADPPLPSGVATVHASILSELGVPGDHGNAVARSLMGDVRGGPEAINAFLRRAYLTHNGLQLADKLGMGRSVEVRVPLADHVLYEAARRLPLHERFSLSESKPFLRRVMRGRIPEAVRLAGKRGFSPPTGFVGAIVDRYFERVLDDPTIRTLMPVDQLQRARRAAAGPCRSPTTRVRSAVARMAGRTDPSGWTWFFFELVMSVLSWQAWRAEPREMKQRDSGVG